MLADLAPLVKADLRKSRAFAFPALSS